MDRSMTTKELFEKIQDILKVKGKLPDILDYGGSEGIYLDLWIEYFGDDGWIRNGIGTFKTLEDSKEAVHVMVGLLADFIIEGSAYINANIDDFTWTGVDVRYCG